MVSTVVLFDIDGTLIHSKGAGRLGACRAMKTAFGVSPTSGEINFAGRTDRGIVEDLFDLHSIDKSESNWRQFQEHYLNHLSKTLGETKGQVLPGVELLLNQLAVASDIAVGLLTGNTQKAAQIKLSHFGIYKHFTFGGFGDYQACRNEVAKATYKATQEHLGQTLAPGRFVIVGDTPNDIACARAINARVVALTTGGFSHEQLTNSQPDAVLSDLRETSRVISLIRIAA